ncbi:MAG TPA: hypothetical protein PL143_16115 [Rhodocyclaceae bacterium]|nr:hypothetical protein [Rhodocyclaceae bacterium]
MLRRVLTVFLWFFALVVALAALVAWRGDALLRVVLERALQPYLVPTVAIGGASGGLRRARPWSCVISPCVTRAARRWRGSARSPSRWPTTRWMRGASRSPRSISPASR